MVSCEENQQDRLLDIIEDLDVPIVLLGHVTKGKIVVDNTHFGFCEECEIPLTMPWKRS